MLMEGGHRERQREGEIGLMEGEGRAGRRS